MSNCIKCQKELDPFQDFCQYCGASQRSQPANGVANKENAIFLYVLCVLTILGSLFGMIRGWLYELVAVAADNEEYIRGWIYILTNIGTLVGAVIMLQKNVSGFYVYMVCQVLYILTVMYTTFIYTDDAGEFAVFIGIIFILPSIVFLFLYAVARKYLS